MLLQKKRWASTAAWPAPRGVSCSIVSQNETGLLHSFILVINAVIAWHGSSSGGISLLSADFPCILSQVVCMAARRKELKALFPLATAEPEASSFAGVAATHNPSCSISTARFAASSLAKCRMARRAASETLPSSKSQAGSFSVVRAPWTYGSTRNASKSAHRASDPPWSHHRASARASEP